MKKGPPRPTKKNTRRKPVKKIIQQATKRLKKAIAAHDPRIHKSRLGNMVEPDAVCVTICTPKYAHLRHDAVESFKKHLGLPVIVIECSEEEGYEMKMKLDLLVPGRKIVFCDIDWRPLRSFVDIRPWDSGQWVAVRDYGAVHPASFASHDIEKHNLDRLTYFNSGFFCCDLSRPWHIAVFVTARSVWRDVQEGKRARVGDFGDQFYLNAAVAELGFGIYLLPAAYNWIHGYLEHGMRAFQPRVVYAVHAAGVPVADKLDHLTRFQEMFGYEAGPVCEGVAIELLATATELS